MTLVDSVREALSRVEEPELHKDLISLDMVKDIRVEGNRARFTVVLTTPACPLKSEIEMRCRREVTQIEGIDDIEVEWDSRVPSHRSAGPQKQQIPGVKNIIAVTSGKGGVGKTTVSVNLAVEMALQGAQVGLCDCDIYGPNVPMMMGISAEPRGENEKIIPLENYGVKMMSMGFLNRDDTPLIWRGPMLHGVIKQFLYQVEWGQLDYLFIDLPPGTGDAQLTIVQSVPLAGGVVVTTPQNVALADARKGISMFNQVNVKVLGIIENMSYFECTECGKRNNIFDHGGGKHTAEKFKVPFLGEIPLQTDIRIGGDMGKPIVTLPKEGSAKEAFSGVCQKLAAQISVANLTAQQLPVIE